MYIIWTTSWHSPTFLYNGYLISLPNEKFSLRTTPFVFLKRKFLTMDGSTWSREREAWHSRHFTASSSQALILKKHEKTSRPIGTNPGKADDFWWVQGVDIPISQKNFHINRTCPAREGPPNPTRTHSSSHTRGCFRCEGFVLGRVFFCSFKKYKDLTRTRGKYRGLCWPVRSLKQIDPLATYLFCMELNKAEASCYCGTLTWLKRTTLQTGMLNPWLKSNWRNKRSYYERPKHHRNYGQISFALKEVAQPTIANSFDQAFSYHLVN